jgi:hypothetical protein
MREMEAVSNFCGLTSALFFIVANASILPALLLV